MCAVSLFCLLFCLLPLNSISAGHSCIHQQQVYSGCRGPTVRRALFQARHKTEEAPALGGLQAPARRADEGRGWRTAAVNDMLESGKCHREKRKTIRGSAGGRHVKASSRESANFHGLGGLAALFFDFLKRVRNGLLPLHWEQRMRRAWQGRSPQRSAFLLAPSPCPPHPPTSFCPVGLRGCQVAQESGGWALGLEQPGFRSRL